MSPFIPSQLLEIAPSNYRGFGSGKTSTISLIRGPRNSFKPPRALSAHATRQLSTLDGREYARTPKVNTSEISQGIYEHSRRHSSRRLEGSSLAISIEIHQESLFWLAIRPDDRGELSRRFRRETSLVLRIFMICDACVSFPNGFVRRSKVSSPQIPSDPGPLLECDVSPFGTPLFIELARDFVGQMPRVMSLPCKASAS
jgi:hypothetical protein